MELSTVNPEEATKLTRLEEHGIELDSIEALGDDFREFTSTIQKGKSRIIKNENNYQRKDQISDKVAHKGETRVRLDFEEMQDRLQQRSEENEYQLPEEDQQRAFGALFGATYALYRQQVAYEDKLPNSDCEFIDTVDTGDELRKFMKSGAYEIRTALVDNQDGYTQLRQMIDEEEALDTYDEVVREMTGQSLGEPIMEI